jgi:predicted dehydrogenase
MLQVFRQSGRVVPVFVDKHLADNWEDAKHIFDTARELGIPLMAGSSVPGSWRLPPVDLARGEALDGIVVVTYGSTDHYGFHALECLQAVVEQRQGGETGVRAVRSLSGSAMWKALRKQEVDSALFEAALRHVSPDPINLSALQRTVPKPILWQIEYADGLRASVVELNGAATGWAGAWRRRRDGQVASTRFWTQEARPAAHFTLLLEGIERMMLEGRPTWTAERTLMSSGLLDALLQSSVQKGRRLETPWLEWGYTSAWRWQEPPPPPPSRPWSEQ